MKKACFYSLHHGNKAVLHDGYTDGRFWYYKHGNTWFAIYPESGTAVAAEGTRKAAADKAFHIEESVIKFYNNHPELIKAYNTAFTRAILHMD